VTKADKSAASLSVAAVIAAGALLPAACFAQTTPAASTSSPWRYSGSLYLYLPSMGGKTSFPADSGGTPINVSADQIIDSLKFTFMGALDAHNGRWGVFTDLIYLDLGGSKSASRDFTIGNIGLPAGTSADLDWDLKGWAWTLAGEYRLPSDPALTLDLLAGTRMFDLKQTLKWNITGSIGPIAPAGRSGSAEVGDRLWDAIVGVKGRYSFGANREWSLPFYLDVGAGESDRTWQGAVGVAYAFKWGELTGLWRYLDYQMKSGQPVQSMNFNGPMIGATWHW
jgi:hypothetical protein